MSETTDGKKHGAIIVGTGFGVLTHLRAMRLAGIDVIALVGRDPAKTRDRATHSNEYKLGNISWDTHCYGVLTLQRV